MTNSHHVLNICVGVQSGACYVARGYGHGDDGVPVQGDHEAGGEGCRESADRDTCRYVGCSQSRGPGDGTGTFSCFFGKNCPLFELLFLFFFRCDLTDLGHFSFIVSSLDFLQGSLRVGS